MDKRTICTLAFPILICLFAGCGEKIEPGETPPASVRTIKTATAIADVVNQPLIYEALGSIAAETASTISGKIMGTVKAVNVKEGDSVSQGDVLAVLDERQVETGLRQAQAGLSEAGNAVAAAVSAAKAAQAQAQLAETTYKKYQKLLEEESATRQEFDEVEAKYSQAQAALAQAEAMVAAARSRVRQTEAGVSSAGVSRRDATVIAPYDGVVTAKFVDEGDLASPGTPLLALEKTGTFQAVLVLPEHHFQAVRIGQTLDVSIPSIEGDSLLVGTVKTIVPTANPKSLSFTVKVGLPENDMLRSGMFVRVSIPVGEGRMLLVPASALVVHGQLTGYYMVGDDGMARFRLMRTGRNFGDRIEVVSGMKPGTRYVIAPPEDLEDGVKVEDEP